MFIQLNLDQMFDVETASDKQPSRWKSPPLSVVSEDVEESKEVKVKAPKYQLDSDKLFKDSADNSIHRQRSEATFPSTEALPSTYDMPGQRLYYEYRHNMVRKMKDLERWKYEMSQQEKDDLTFTPKINKNTQKILSNRQQNPENQIKAKQRRLEKVQQFEESQKLKNFEELKQCTFRPKIAKNENVFHNLYRQSRMKQIRLKVKQQPPQQQKQPNGQQMINDFLNRNDQFLDRIKKKQFMLQKKSLQFDMSTGEKLFTPRITKVTPVMQHSRSGAIFNKNPSLHNLNSKLKQKYEESQRVSMQQRDDDGQQDNQQLFEDDEDMEHNVRKMIDKMARSNQQDAEQ